jgi:hypothetical protein
LPFVEFVEEIQEEDYRKGKQDLVRKRHQELSEVAAGARSPSETR